MLVLAACLVVGLISGISSECDNSKNAKQQAEAARAEEERRDAERKATTTSTLASIAAAKKPSVETGRLCVSLGGNIPAQSLIVCRDSEVLLARERIANRDVPAARAAFDLASAAGAAGAEMKRLNGTIERVARDEKRKSDEAGDKAEAMASKKREDFRRDYAKKLRNQFLDDGMDVAVSVTGKHATRLTLKYSLFGAVWTHNYIQKDNVLEVLKAMGFRRIDIENGWDYHVYFDLGGK